MRHALLVMGHGNLNIMKKYMEILDDERFDFYIHIDKKSKDDGRWLKIKGLFHRENPSLLGASQSNSNGDDSFKDII